MNPTSSPLRALILCTGNSARSILAEYLLRKWGHGRFTTCSAGSQPVGRVNPFALRVLREVYGIDASDARSKSWNEFHDQVFDYVITVCDHAKDACPVWPKATLVAHWGSPDPAAVTGSDDEKLRAFVDVAAQIEQRVKRLCALSPADARDAELVRAIGAPQPTA
jgi:arsenate reductase (thioredoxin)